ncbi:hypothetical protein [Clostridium sp. UBA7339]|uniref:hypothetical protein n=1 Tax=Clostridium sp. UBA7339 TaxID=1946376 RepID=UPI003217DCF3
MNYEKIVLELFARVKELEEKVEELEDKTSLNNNAISKDMESEDEDIKITRNYSRQYVIEKFRENNPNVLVDKANRSMGGGIVIKDKSSRKIIKAKFYHSKSYNDECPSGWHTVNEEELLNSDIDSFIFNLEYQKKFYTFIFTTDELRGYVKDKDKDQNNNYYFYFNIKDQKALEYRDGEKDVTKYLNRWGIVSQII